MNVGEPGEWTHGWQYWASSISDTFFRRALLSNRIAAWRTGGCTLDATVVQLAFAPTTPELTIAPHLFRVLVLERLHLPLPITEEVCEGCGAPVDIHGRLGTLSSKLQKKKNSSKNTSSKNTFIQKHLRRFHTNTDFFDCPTCDFFG